MKKKNFSCITGKFFRSLLHSVKQEHLGKYLLSAFHKVEKHFSSIFCVDVSSSDSNFDIVRKIITNADAC